MTDYISAAIPQSRAAIKQIMLDAYLAALPGAAVDPGTPLDVILDGAASYYAQLGEQATELTDRVYRRYGEKIARTPPRAATSAATTITATATVGQGGILDAGTEISLATPDGADRRLFQITAAATIAAGATQAGIPIVAVDAGSDSTGLDDDPQLEIVADWVQSITVDTPSTGGEDEEDDTTYMNRLADEGPLQAITIVRAEDAARLARNTPGIGTALALDLYDADTATANVGGHLSVVVRSDTGTAVSGPIKTALAAAISARAVADLETHVIDPTYTTVTIVFAGLAETGANAAEVEARAEAEIEALISPALWGLPSFGDAQLWQEKTVLYRQDVITALNNVEGFSRYTTLTINGSSTADLTLTGPGALPAALPTSSVAGTVT